MRNIIHSAVGFAILVIVFNIFGCAKKDYPSAEEINNLKSNLSQLKGEFVWREDLGKYHYSEKLRIEEILSVQSSEKSVAILVDSLDDKSKTQSKIDNEIVSLGVICYEALTQLVYYEPTTMDGDIAQHWPGYISPKSTPDEIRAAKQAWKKVIEEKSYQIQ
jgi:hypothetical protein